VVVDVDWTARARAMERVPWLAPIGQGELTWRAKGSIVEGRVQASVDGTVARFVRPGVTLAEGRINGTVRGPFDALAIDASLEGKDFHPGPLAFDEVRAKAEGPLGRLAVVVGVSGENQAKLGVRAVVESAPAGTRVHEVELAAARGEVAVFAKVRRIEVIGDRVAFEGISVDGAGGPIAGSISISPTDAKVHMSADDIDLAKVGAIFLPGAVVEGRLAFDVDAEIGHRDERGHARVRLQDGRLGEVAGVSLHGEADVTGGQVSGGVDAVWGTLGSITVTTSAAQLAGSPLRTASWQNAAGRLQIDSALDLDRLSDSFAAVLGPLGQAGGAARAKIVLSRSNDAPSNPDPSRAPATPDVDLLFWTDGLRFGKKADGVSRVADAPSEFSSDGVDVQLALHVDGDEPKGELTARLVDAEGVFAGLSASSSDVRLLDFWRDPARASERLTQMPMTAELTLPRRNLAVYPFFARPRGWRGEIEGKGTLTGSIGTPMVGLNVSGHAVEPSGAGLGLPVDLDAQARYDGKRALARVRASRPEGVVFDGMTQIDARVEKVLARLTSGSPSPNSPDTDAHRARAESWWEATGRARLYRFPLASVPLLSENVVGGFAGGVLTFRGINRDPEIEAQIDATNLTLDAATFPTSMAELRIAKGRAVISAKLDQTAGGASATASGSVKWDSPFFPEIDKNEPLDFSVEARDLRVAALYPLFLRKVFSHFDGRLNGTMHARLAGQGGEGGDTVEGAFDLQDASLLVPEIGQEFRKGSAHIAVTERGHVEVSNVAASGVTGRLTASGNMALKGLAFESAEGEVRIAKKEAVPLTVEGVSLGDAWGTLMLHAKMADDHTVKLDVDVPTFHADMPQSSSRDVQALADNPEIAVGIRRPSAELVPVHLTAPVEERAEGALAWQVKFYLGQDAVLKLGSMMQLTLGGEPVVTLTDRARVAGVVELRSGVVEVFGKRFEIEHGKAEFEGDDPSNPNVTVTARWEAPDGTRVYADYVGPLRTGLLSLRSEPARSQSEVLATLLYGTGDDTIAAPGSSIRQEANRTNTAGALIAGSAMSTSVNRVLASVTPLDITTRVTSDAQSPTPEVAFRVSPRVSAMLSYRTRTPTLNEKPDRVLVTLDWRFRRNWSVVTTIGNLGGSVLDLIWRYRY
jgi:translocation and assembly module TamB